MNILLVEAIPEAIESGERTRILKDLEKSFYIKDITDEVLKGKSITAYSNYTEYKLAFFKLGINKLPYLHEILNYLNSEYIISPDPKYTMPYRIKEIGDEKAIEEFDMALFSPLIEAFEDR